MLDRSPRAGRCRRTPCPRGARPADAAAVLGRPRPASRRGRDRLDDGWRLPADGSDRSSSAGARSTSTPGSARGSPSTAPAACRVRIDPRHALDLECTDGSVRAVWAVGDIRHVLGERPADDEAELEIRMLPGEGHEFSTARGPDRVVAGVVGRRRFTALGQVDGRYLSTEVAGGMTGRLRRGLVRSSGDVLIRSFAYVGADEDLP